MDVQKIEIGKNCRPSLLETRSQTTGDLAPANTCSNVPLDNVRAVAVETTPNPPAYWPLPSLSAANFFQGAINDSQVMASAQNPFFKKVAAKKAADSDRDSTPREESGEAARRFIDESHSSLESSTAKTLQHKLPPIAGITSSHNSRAAWEMQKRNERPNAIQHSSEPESLQSNGRHGPTVEPKTLFQPGRDKINTGPHAVDDNLGRPVTPSSSAPQVGTQMAPKSGSTFSSGATAPPRSPATTTQNSSCVTSMTTTSFADKFNAVPQNSCSKNLMPSRSPSFSVGNNFSSHYSASVTAGSTSTLCVPSSSANSPKSIYSNMQKSSFVERIHPPSTHHVWELQSNTVHTTLPYNMPNSRSMSGFGVPGSAFCRSSEAGVQGHSAVKNGSSHGSVEGTSAASNNLPGREDDRFPPNHSRSPQPRDQIKNSQPMGKGSSGSATATSHSPYHSILQQYQHRLPPNQLHQQSFSSNVPRTIAAKESHETHLPFELHKNGNQSSTTDSNRVVHVEGYESHLKRLNAKANPVDSESKWRDYHVSMDSREYHRSKYSGGIVSGEVIQRNFPILSDESNRTDANGSMAKKPGSRSDVETTVELSHETVLLNTQSKVNKHDLAETPRNKRFGETQSETSGVNYENHNGREIYCSEKPKRILTSMPDVHRNEGFKANGQTDSTSFKAKFPPVPQSNYDLKKQIYESMTRDNRPPQASPLASNPAVTEYQSSYYREHCAFPGPSIGTHSSCRPRRDENSDMRQISSVKLDGDRTATSPTLSNAYRDGRGHPRWRHNVPPGNDSFVKCSNIESNASKPSVSGVHESSAPSSDSGCGVTKISLDCGLGDRKLQSPAADRQENGEPRSDSFHLPDSRCMPPSISSSQSKEKMTSCEASGRSKRESPLDLSVKTVRQTADSTAKDDGDTLYQNVRNFMGENRHLSYPAGRLPVATAGAPKIDFTPNFSGFHSDGVGLGTSSRQKPDASALPSVASFKKVQGKTTTCDSPEEKINFSGSPYFPCPLLPGQKSRRNEPSLKQTHAELAKLEAQKRLSINPSENHLPPAKVPKIDSWRVAFDQEIEQRLNSARVNLQNNRNSGYPCNGIERTDSFMGLPSRHSVTSRHSSGSVHRVNATVYPQTPVQTSAAPYNPAYVRQPQCLPATPQTPKDKMEQLGNMRSSPDPEQIIKQISKGVMPDYKLLQDKHVLSILRSSLEEKEAKLMQLREAAKKRERAAELPISDVSNKRFQPYDKSCKSQNNASEGISSFRDLTSERMGAPPPPPPSLQPLPVRNQRLHRLADSTPMAVEAIRRCSSPTLKKETEKSGIPCMDPSPQDDAQSPPTDFDGLAAFLAARIRTKGELKEVVPVAESDQADSESDLREMAKSYANTSCGGNPPPKLVKEPSTTTTTRRFVLGHAEEGATAVGHMSERPRPPPRDANGIRSSSETSVFDFRDSDSESDMPVLERQTLEEMRRDRKISGSKPNALSLASSGGSDATDKPEIVSELDASRPDPFWGTAFDMFVEELEKRPPKRSSRKKKIFSRTPFDRSSKKDWEESSVEPSTTVEKVIENSTVSEEKKVKVESEDVADTKNQFVEEETKNFDKSRIKLGEKEDSVNDIKPSECFKLEENLAKSRDENKKEKKGEDSEWRKTEIKSGKKSKVGKRKMDSDEDVEKEQQKKLDSATKNFSDQADNDDGFGEDDESEDAGDDDDDEEEEDEDEDEDEEEDDDDDSLSLSCLESESSESETSPESSNSAFSSSNDSENEGSSKKRINIRMRMRTRRRTRLQTRSSKQKETKDTGMRLRSRKTFSPAGNAKKPKKKRKEEFFSRGKKKRKPPFGDGSAFRPGWEEECYKFKQQLRMPEKLISISRPSKRTSTSLPDLDPYGNSSSRDSCELSGNKKNLRGKSGSKKGQCDRETAADRSDAGNSPDRPTKSHGSKRFQSSSIINHLVKKYGKGNMKSRKEVKCESERKSPRILPRATNKPELLPTPSLGLDKENALSNRKKNKDCPEEGKKDDVETDSSYVGYFRRKTVKSFKEAFKENGALIPQQDFSPTVLESRTRRQARDLKKRATLIEVFGDERPASAPPLTRDEGAPAAGPAAQARNPARDLSPKRKSDKSGKNVKSGVGVVTRGKAVRSGRPGLRSAAVLRSNKALQMSKRHLNSGRKRSLDLLRMRALASKKKFSYLVKSSDGANQLPITKKRLKLRSVRRKFRSGFDYIRKKKKLKKDGDSADGSVKEKKVTARPTSVSVEDIQNEIKNWVINKGLGETILHRAARLGYTDVAAYCLEKMGCSPSPRDNAGYTPLHEACSRGHLEVAKLLLMYGASVSESAKGGVRPLHEAAENGFTELIRLLLSFGADPLLETYTGHTALSLVTDEEARRLIQHHLADVQGNVAPVWTFRGPSSLFDPTDSGYDPLSQPPSPDPPTSDTELEISDAMLPPLYRLPADGDPDRHWMLMTDLLSYAKLKSKDVLLKQLESSSVREMKASDFHDQGRCCNILNAEKPRTKASKVVLVHYDDNVRRMLDVETIILSS